MRNFIMAAVIVMSVPAYAADIEKDPHETKCQEAVRVASTTNIGIEACNRLWAFHPGSIRLNWESDFCVQSGELVDEEIDDLMNKGADRFDQAVEKMGIEKTCSIVWKKIIFSIGKD